MKLIEFFFDIEKSDNVNTFSVKDYDFWTFDGKDTYYTFRCYKKFHDTDIGCFLQVMCDFDFNFNAEFYVEWSKLQPLFDIELTDNSEVPEQNLVMPEQYLIIRGFCSANVQKVLSHMLAMPQDCYHRVNQL